MCCHARMCGWVACDLVAHDRDKLAEALSVAHMRHAKQLEDMRARLRREAGHAGAMDAEDSAAAAAAVGLDTPDGGSAHDVELQVCRVPRTLVHLCCERGALRCHRPR
jgi:hypothetical protein